MRVGLQEKLQSSQVIFVDTWEQNNWKYCINSFKTINTIMNDRDQKLLWESYMESKSEKTEHSDKKHSDKEHADDKK